VELRQIFMAAADLVQNFQLSAGCDELHISETLRVITRAINRGEVSINSGNEDAFHVSLQILQPILWWGRQSETVSGLLVKKVLPTQDETERPQSESNRPDSVQ
jgi:hypothetical protein